MMRSTTHIYCLIVCSTWNKNDSDSIEEAMTAALQSGAVDMLGGTRRRTRP